MKKSMTLISMLVILSLFTFGQTTSSSKGIKIGVISPDRVVQNTARGKAIIESLNKLGRAKQQKIQNLRKELEDLNADLQKPLSTSAKEEKQLLIQRKQTALKRFVQDSQAEYQREFMKVKKKLYDEIMPIIKKIGKDKGFTIIFDITTSGISYFDDKIDITNEVIIQVNAKYQK
jgi:Skp family chaperone for outer membrane proteins